MTWTTCRSIAGLLAENHYLGAIDRGVAWHDGQIITRDEAKAAHGICDAELDEWFALYRRGGYLALRGTPTKLRGGRPPVVADELV